MATKWFICLFADVVPMETVLRIFDCLFYEGDKILFRACIALVKLHLDEIVKCHQFPDVVLTFRNICKDKQTLYCHEFLQPFTATLNQAENDCLPIPGREKEDYVKPSTKVICIPLPSPSTEDREWARIGHS
ncbi:unnamed protein product [Dibothriocephalus latus]|uniref:Rab-GAP TBC domain-containing protein n=1 Tax=Dibothriocephalus latus TaxID=60516 RepID=A0A3P7P0N5_DIBLA|nr:unnamed protein product [Dibothriocephalus latus]